MPNMSRRDFLKIAGVGAPIAGVGAYKWLTQGQPDGVSTGLGPRTADADALPPNSVALAHPPYRPLVRTAPFKGMRRVSRKFGTNGPPDLMDFQPSRVASSGGVLETELLAEFSTNPVVGGIPLNFRTYDGVIPGRTLVARPGDVLKIRHINNFPPRDDDFIKPEDENIPHGFNNINLHTHGLNASPAGNEDNILLTIHPGEEFFFEIKIPEDHPCGTFWYHPHKHGSALHQLASGMAGFLIIEGGEGDLNLLPEVAAAKDVEIAFQELVIDFNGEVPDVTVPIQSLFKFEAFLQYTVNGLAINEGADEFGQGGVAPVLHMRPGEVQRWRLGVLAHLQTYRFAFEGHQIYIAAYDGITDEQLTAYDDFIMAPGNRFDLLIKASDTPGTYAFKLVEERFGEFPLFVTPSPFLPEQTIFNVIVEGEPLDMPLPATLNPPRARLPFITDGEIVRQRQIDFSVTGDVIFTEDFSAFIADTRQFFVNEQKFSSRRIDQTMELGTAEEWLITNDPSINHPFHIHVNHFLVMEIRHSDGHIERPNGGLGRWYDTIDVPFEGSVLLRHRFEKFAGVSVFHCHIIAHEDEGMMQVIEIVDPTPITQRISALDGGVLVSGDFTNRVIARFFPHTFAEDTDVTYSWHLEPPHPINGDFIGLERYFTLNGVSGELERQALVEVKFPIELTGGVEFDLNTVRLYRYSSSQAAWHAQGVNLVSLNKGGILVSSISRLGTYAVLALPPSA